MIAAVLGDVSPDGLGFCQSHEHIYMRPCPAQTGEAIDDLEKSRAELELFRSCGGRAVVDAQPIGTGRDAGALAKLSRESGVHVVASTGFHKLSYYPADHWVFSAAEKELAGLFVRELVSGMYLDGDFGFPAEASGFRAGQIKTALDAEGLSPPYLKLFVAAAAAARETGSPIMTHIEKGSDPLKLAAFLRDQGVPPERLVFCHLDRAVRDLGVHKELCRMGVNLEYDTVGRPKYHDDERELEIVAEMLAAGHGERLLFGLDTTRARLQSYGGVPGLCHILKSFVPFMLKNGVGEADARRFFVENPARVFSRR